jgi:hypothetical protein
VRHIHVPSELSEGVDLTQPPPIDPRGGFEARPKATFDPPPRLCEQGPCVHYHRLGIQMDVEAPKGDGVDAESGAVLGAAGEMPIHIQTSHYCYPDVGIEMVLGSEPVMSCNLWEPRSRNLEAVQQAYLKSPEGNHYQGLLARWIERQHEAAKAAESAADDAERVLAEAVRARTHKRVEGTEFCESDCPACADEARRVREELAREGDL